MQASQKKFLHDLAVELLGLQKNQVVWANQNRPRLNPPFAVLRFYSPKREAQEEIRSTATPGIVNVMVSVSGRLEVQLFEKPGADPMNEIEIMVRSLEKPTVADKCFAARMAFFDSEPVQDITAALEAQTFEPRAAVDLSIRYTSLLTDDVGIVNEVSIAGKTDQLAQPIDVKGE